MIQVKFKNLEKSELAHEAVFTRIEPIIFKFPDLAKGSLQVTLEMENSPLKAGADLFKVKLFIPTGRYRGLTVEKSNINLYLALSDLVEHMLEKLNRFGDKVRVKERKIARQINRRKIIQNGGAPEVNI